MAGAFTFPGHPLVTGAALLVILLVAAYFRFTGLNWDDGHHLHPDERFLTMVENALELPGSVGAYFDTAQSPLNPHNKGTRLLRLRHLSDLLGAVPGGVARPQYL